MSRPNQRVERNVGARQREDADFLWSADLEQA